MIQALLVALREGTEAVLVVALILACLQRTGRRSQAPSVYLGLVLAVLASVAAALGLHHIAIGEDAMEGILELAASVMVATMLVWTHRTARHIRSHIESAVASSASPATSSGWFSLGLFSFTFIMVFREGVEAALFLSALSFSSDTLATVLGGLLGLALAAAFGIALIRGSLQINVARFLQATEVVLAILLVQLAISGYHELAEVGWLPSGRLAMAIIGPFVKHGTLLVVAVAALPLGLVLLGTAPTPVTAQDAGPERRLQIARARRERLTRALALSSGLAVILLLNVGYVFAQRGLTLDAPAIVAAEGPIVRIPAKDLPPGTFKRYGVLAGQSTVRFFFLADAEGKIRGALDLCEICGPAGYAFGQDTLTCLNCSADINPQTLGQTGGCNPIPLPFTQSHGDLVVKTADLLKEARAFADPGPQVVDPVCRMTVAIEHAGAQASYGGKTYYFCSNPGCVKAFLADPTRFAR